AGTIEVPAEVEWTNTFIPVSSGDKLTITATGLWGVGQGSGSGVGPDGETNIANDYYPLPGERIGALIGKIDDQVFLVGSSLTATVDVSGYLFLGANETPYCRGNEWGSLCVAVQNEFITVEIDIKPGSDPNCFNLNGHGVIPVAILGSADFDVSDIDVETLSFAGLEVRVRGNKGPLCSTEYSNEDEFLDLVCHFEDDPENWVPQNDMAELTGELVDGTPIEGTDSICIVP
ncbi:MAG: LecA/PA-IL family lectin, partial [Thermodesulfobacteriota bacterium]|nr:LecA/PA-IL family lectin [Thermodesulfobacteriota bacterium]